MTIRRHAAAALLAGLLAACRATPTPDAPAGADAPRLPTGRLLDPAGTLTDVGPLPLGLRLSPDGRRVVLLLSGWRTQGVQVVDRATGRVTQTLPQKAAFVGLAFAPDGRALWASGGDRDVVYRYAWADGGATLQDSVVLAPLPKSGHGTRYPAGIGVSPDGRLLYVAENLADSLAVVDVATGAVVQRLATQRYPYDVAVAPDGTVWVSAWGGQTVSRFAPREGRLADVGRLPVGRHPSALLLSRDGARLFVASASTDRVAVVDTRAGAVLAQLDDPPPAGPHEGSTPNGLALSPDGTRLFVAEADANAVAVFDLSARTSGVAAARGDDRLAGRLPAGWYPTGVLAAGDTLLVTNGKGRGTAPNAQDGPGPRQSREHQGSRGNTTLYQIQGTLATVAGAVRADAAQLAAWSRRVAHANAWDASTDRRHAYPPIEHVVYVIKENRTYDQVLGDLPQGDGDSSLTYFGRAVAPNHHALAERFGVYDRFFVNAEVSPDGHNWSTAAYTTDYLQKTVPSNYSQRGRTYDWEGTNRGRIPSEEGEEDAAEPASGYLWDLAQRHGITFRNYGEFVVPERERERAGELPTGYRGNKPFLAAHTHRAYPGYDLDIPDQRRADVWIAELQAFARQGRMPQLMVVRLPNDHTAGARAGAPTPRAYMADNDLALGRMIEALSRTPFWRSTAVFVLEDDAQNGPDHVDSHRSPLLVISPWARPGLHHRWTNTTDVLRTIEELLGLASLSQFDHFGRPLRDVWAARPDTTPWVALRPGVSLDERNPRAGEGARESARLDLRIEDAADEALFNRVLWRAVKGPNVPYPGARRAGSAEVVRAR